MEIDREEIKKIYQKGSDRALQIMAIGDLLENVTEKYEPEASSWTIGGMLREFTGEIMDSFYGLRGVIDKLLEENGAKEECHD